MQRIPALVLRLVHAGPVLEEQSRLLGLPVPRGQVQARPALPLSVGVQPT